MADANPSARAKDRERRRLRTVARLPQLGGHFN